jgi:hypothetical protein
MRDDDIYISKALAEYRNDSGDDRDFLDLEAEVHHEILKRARVLKAEREREKGGRNKHERATAGDGCMKQICVFCGSSAGSRPEYRAATEELGTELARRNIGWSTAAAAWA